MVERSSSGQALRGILGAGGFVATLAGAHSMLLGTKALPGKGTANAVIESEQRYYAGFYTAFGLAALRIAPRAQDEPTAVRRLAGVLFGSGLARAGAWVTVGPPHPLQRVLLGLELGLPPLIVALSAAATRAPATSI